MKDYLLQVKVKNAPMMRAIRAAGIANASELARLSLTGPKIVGALLNLKLAPQNTAGEWRAAVIRISKCLRALPEDLFPPQHLREPLETTSGEFEASLDEIAAYLPGATADPLEALQTKERNALLSEALSKLPVRHERVLRLRFGLDENSRTLDEVSKDLGVGRERVRQLELNAIRKLKRQVQTDRRLADVLGHPHEVTESA